MPSRVLSAFFHLSVVAFFLMIVATHHLGLRSVEVELGASLSGPSFDFPLGRDNLGRDLLGRISEAVGSSVLGVWAGVFVGQIAGGFLAALFVAKLKSSFWRGLAVVGRLGGLVLVSVPAGVLAFALAVWTEVYSVGLVALVLGAVFLAATAFQVAGLWIQSSQLAWWQAHEAMGGGPLQRIWRCGVLGLWRGDLALSLVQGLKLGVAIEAAMSWLGFGVQEPRASFGNMIAAHFETWLRGDYRILVVIIMALWLVAQTPESLRQVLLLLKRKARIRRQSPNAVLEGQA